MQKLKSFLAGLLIGSSTLAPTVLAHDLATVSGGGVLVLIALSTLFLLKKGK